MPWMTRLPGAFPIHVRQAHGAIFNDVDDIEYIDFCLGDTGSMTGHGVNEITEAIAAQIYVAIVRLVTTANPISFDLFSPNGQEKAHLCPNWVTELTVQT